ncbi:MAG TPA: divalent-cation tolerance protein CutA [Burkholderiaceae bacterium]|jgi:periplasmic divalent cation tolerance protein|nr:divalent-cation tolerance protein CutA [Burkholderiaceae bacterium]
MTQSLVVLTNLPNLAAAQALARHLVQQRLAACINILPAVRSVYQWQGAIEEADEVPLLVKTSTSRYAELESAIKAAHPYQVPEIIALPITAGLPAYLDWIAQTTKRDLHV